jgi:NNP family nitrate/nitrite transporter-like MFS transporter
MAAFRTFLKAGHAPTLFAPFLYFTYCCGVWVTNGAMAPFVKESLQLSPAQVGFMLSVPIFAGALMRFPLGVLAQYIGRKNATLVEMGGIALALGFGYFFVETFSDLLAMGVLLGIAGASFGVALSLGSGNVGTSLSALLAPQRAMAYGWQTVYGIAAIGLIVPVLVMIVFAQEPDDVDAHAKFRDHIACLFEKDGWGFSILYAITFGGFIGLITFLPSYCYDQFSVTKVQAGQLTMLAAFMGAATRIFGGWISDHWGGINTLTAVLVIISVSLVLCGFAGDSLVATTLLLVCFAALGAGNGALFQLVPLRWPTSTAVAGSMIGEIGALGGGLVPTVMVLSKQYAGSYLWGFVLFAVLSLGALTMMRSMQIRWTRTWAEKGGRARTA